MTITIVPNNIILSTPTTQTTASTNAVAAIAATTTTTATVAATTSTVATKAAFTTSTATTTAAVITTTPLYLTIDEIGLMVDGKPHAIYNYTQDGKNAIKVAFIASHEFDRCYAHCKYLGGRKNVQEYEYKMLRILRKPVISQVINCTFDQNGTSFFCHWLPKMVDYVEMTSGENALHHQMYWTVDYYPDDGHDDDDGDGNHGNHGSINVIDDSKATWSVCPNMKNGECTWKRPPPPPPSSPPLPSSSSPPPALSSSAESSMLSLLFLNFKSGSSGGSGGSGLRRICVKLVAFWRIKLKYKAQFVNFRNHTSPLYCKLLDPRNPRPTPLRNVVVAGITIGCVLIMVLLICTPLCIRRAKKRYMDINIQPPTIHLKDVDKSPSYQDEADYLNKYYKPENAASDDDDDDDDVIHEKFLKDHNHNHHRSKNHNHQPPLPPNHPHLNKDNNNNNNQSKNHNDDEYDDDYNYNHPSPSTTLTALSPSAISYDQQLSWDHTAASASKTAKSATTANTAASSANTAAAGIGEYVVPLIDFSSGKYSSSGISDYVVNMNNAAAAATTAAPTSTTPTPTTNATAGDSNIRDKDRLNVVNNETSVNAKDAANERLLERLQIKEDDDDEEEEDEEEEEDDDGAPESSVYAILKHDDVSIDCDDVNNSNKNNNSNNSNKIIDSRSQNINNININNKNINNDMKHKINKDPSNNNKLLQILNSINYKMDDNAATTTTASTANTTSTTATTTVVATATADTTSKNNYTNNNNNNNNNDININRPSCSIATANVNITKNDIDDDDDDDGGGGDDNDDVVAIDADDDDDGEEDDDDEDRGDHDNDDNCGGGVEANGRDKHRIANYTAISCIPHNNNNNNNNNISTSNDDYIVHNAKFAKSGR